MTRGNPEILNHLDLDWLEDMFLYSLDYCLGRMSYAPSVCIDFLKPCLPYMQNRVLGVIYRRINEFNFDAFKTGDMMYPREWNAFKDEVEAELQKRGWKYHDYAY